MTAYESPRIDGINMINIGMSAATVRLLTPNAMDLTKFIESLKVMFENPLTVLSTSVEQVREDYDRSISSRPAKTTVTLLSGSATVTIVHIQDAISHINITVREGHTVNITSNEIATPDGRTIVAMLNEYRLKIAAKALREKQEKLDAVFSQLLTGK